MQLPPAIEVEGLRYAYPDGSPGLGGVDLQVAAGSITALLGANGTGKSTLLLSVLGLVPASGTIRVFGDTVEDRGWSDVRRSVGLIFQNPDDQLFCSKVADDVAFGPLNLGWSRDRVEAAVDRALAEVGMAGYGERVPQHLSFGEKKKIAIAAVLAMEPKVLVLDEPTAGLDPRSAGRVVDLLADLCDRGVTILCATHDLHLVEAIADRLVVLNEARRVGFAGEPADLLGDHDALVRYNLAHAHVHRHRGGWHRHVHDHGPHGEGDHGSGSGSGTASST
ncbi:MAG: ABC transporter ATP-binding protein [Myxococcales bacterium]|nr:ABC transporter ATP-binding protein [Myxococcales bacterium]